MVYENGRWKKEDKEQSKAASMAACQLQIIDNGEGVCTSRYVNYVLTLAKAWLAIRPEDFDNNPLLMCCADGVLSLAREGCGEFLEHSPEYLLIRSTGVSLREFCVPEPDPSGADGDERLVVRLPSEWGYGSSEWEHHLEFMTQNLSEEAGKGFRRFYKRWSGTALLGSQDLKPHHFLNLTGKGRNGKGIAARARLRAMGDYGMDAPSRLVTRRQSDHSTELAGCEGRRLLVIEEVSLVQSAIIKDLTGGGRMSARRMRQDDVTFEKSWALELNTNTPLNLQGESTKAMKRRKIVANLGDEVPAENHHDGIAQDLASEAGLILCWMVDGLRDWYKAGGKSAGLAIPSWMLVESEQQSDDDDVIGALLVERYARKDGERTLGSAFVKAVNERRKEASFLPLTPAAIYSYLRDAGFEVRSGQGNKTFVFDLGPLALSLAEMSVQFN